MTQRPIYPPQGLPWDATRRVEDLRTSLAAANAAIALWLKSTIEAQLRRAEQGSDILNIRVAEFRGVAHIFVTEDSLIQAVTKAVSHRVSVDQVEMALTMMEDDGWLARRAIDLTYPDKNWWAILNEHNCLKYKDFPFPDGRLHFYTCTFCGQEWECHQVLISQGVSGWRKVSDKAEVS